MNGERPQTDTQTTNAPARVLRNWSRLVASRGLSLVLATLSLIVAREALPPAAQADFFWFLAIYALFALGALCGLSTALVPALARNPDGPRALAFAAETAVRARRRSVVASVAFVAVALAFAPHDLWIAASAFAIALQPLLLGSNPSLASGQTHALARIEVQGRLLSLACLGGLFAVGCESAGLFLCAWTIPQAIAAAGYARSNPAAFRSVLGIRQFLPGDGARRPDTALPSLSAALDKTSAGDLMRASYLHGIPIVVGALAGDQFADFGFAHRFFLIAALVPAALSTVLAGPLANITKITSVATRSRILVLAAIAIAVAVCIYAIGSQWNATSDAAVQLLLILLTALPAIFIASITLPFLLAKHREGAALKISAAGLAAASLAVAVLWSRAPSVEAGLVGAAIAIVVCEWTVAALSLFATSTHAKSSLASPASGEGVRP